MNSLRQLLLGASIGLPMLAGPLGGADRPELNLQAAPSSPASALAFAPDGRLLASMSLDGSGLQLWAVSSGSDLRTLNTGPLTARGTPCFVFIDGGAHIESFHSGKIQIWDVQTRRPIESTPLAGTPSGEAILSPDGRWVAVFPNATPAPAVLLHADDNLGIWDARSGRLTKIIEPVASAAALPLSVPGGQNGKLAKSLKAATANVPRKFSAAAFSADGSRLATWETGIALESSSTIRIWDIATGRQQTSIPVPERASGSSPTALHDRTLAFSPDGRSLALLVRSESRNAAATPTANVDAMRKLMTTRNPKAAMVAQVEASLSAGENIESRIAVWDVASGRPLVSWGANMTAPSLGPVDHLAAGRVLAWSAKGLLAAAVDDTTVKWFDVNAGAEGGTWKIPAGAVALAIDAEGSLVAIAEQNESIALHDLRTGHVVRELGGSVVPLVDVAFSSDGRRVSAGGYRAATLWDLASGIRKNSVVIPETYGKQFVEWSRAYTQGGFFSADGSLVAVGSITDPLVKVWNVNSGKEVVSFGLSPLTELRAGAFSPDGKLLAVVEQSGEGAEARAAQSKMTTTAVMQQVLGSRNRTVRGC
jgi:WD40 repeat protein